MDFYKKLQENVKNIFERVKRNPEGVISNIEEDIIIFSRYFGLENKNSVNTLFARRNNFPFGLKSKPFKVVLSVLSEEKDLKINVKNEFDKNKAEDEVSVNNAIDEITKMEFKLRKLELQDFTQNPNEQYEHHIQNRYVARNLLFT